MSKLWHFCLCYSCGLLLTVICGQGILNAQPLQRFGDTLQVHIAGNSMPFGAGYLYASSGTTHSDSSIGIVLYRFPNWQSNLPDTAILIRDTPFLLTPAWIGLLNTDSIFIAATEYPFQQNSRGRLYWLDNQFQVKRTLDLDYPGKNLQLQWAARSTSGTIYLSGSITQDNGLSNDLYLAAVSSDGLLLWDRSLGGPGNEKGHKVVVGNNGKLYASADSDQGTLMNAVFALDTLGNLDWFRYIGDENENGTQFLHFSESNQRLYLCGESTTAAGPSFSIYMASLLLTGEIERTAYIGGHGTEAAFFMRPDPTDDNRLWLSGYTNSYDSNSPVSPFLAQLSTDFSTVESAVFPVGEVAIAKNFHFLGNDSLLLLAEGQSGHWLGRISRTTLSDALFQVQQVNLKITESAGTLSGILAEFDSGRLRISGLRSDLPVRLSWFDSTGRLLCQKHWEEGHTAIWDTLPEISTVIWVVEQPSGRFAGKVISH